MDTQPLQITIHPLPTAPQSSSQDGGFLTDGGSFKDVLDTINPLQQLPIVSTLYRSITGDTISSGARLAGGTLYGGPIGFLSALFNEIVKTQTGSDIGENIVALAEGKDVKSASSVDESTATEASNLTLHEQKSYNAYVQAQSLFA